MFEDARLIVLIINVQCLKIALILILQEIKLSGPIHLTFRLLVLYLLLMTPEVRLQIPFPAGHSVNLVLVSAGLCMEVPELYPC